MASRLAHPALTSRQPRLLVAHLFGQAHAANIRTASLQTHRPITTLGKTHAAATTSHSPTTARDLARPQVDVADTGHRASLGLGSPYHRPSHLPLHHELGCIAA